MIVHTALVPNEKEHALLVGLRWLHWSALVLNGSFYAKAEANSPTLSLEMAAEAAAVMKTALKVE